MMRFIFVLSISLFFIGCKTKNSLVKDYIKGQLSRLDTSRYNFKKIETVNSLSDTVAIKNTEVRQYAKDFLDLPELSEDDMKDDYIEKHIYDDLQNAFVFTYTAKKDELIREQHVTVEPEINKDGKNDIRSVYVDFWTTKDNAAIRKNMIWEANNFYVTTTTDSQGKPQNIKTVKIIWNDFEGQNQ